MCKPHGRWGDGGGGRWSRWRLEGRLLEGGSPLGGGEKAVCLADKIHGRAPGSSMHHPLHSMKSDGFVEKMPSETDVAPKAISGTGWMDGNV